MAVCVLLLLDGARSDQCFRCREIRYCGVLHCTSTGVMVVIGPYDITGKYHVMCSGRRGG